VKLLAKRMIAMPIGFVAGMLLIPVIPLSAFCLANESIAIEEAGWLRSILTYAAIVLGGFLFAFVLPLLLVFLCWNEME
jgi:amino acid transporter